MYDVKIYGRTGCPHCFFTERKMQDVKDAMVTIIQRTGKGYRKEM